MVAPLIWIGWTAGAAIAASFSSCSSTKEEAINDIASSKNTANDTTVDDIGSTDSPDSAPAYDLGAQPDTFTADSAKDIVSVLYPNFPLNGKLTLFAQSPCGKGSFISDIDDNGFGTCSGNPDSMIFKFNNSGIVQSKLVTILPDQIAQGEDGQLAITGYDPTSMHSGTLQSDSITSTSTWMDFSKTEVGQSTFTPNFPKGLVFASRKLFIATSNITFGTDSKPSTYEPGTLISYSDGSNSAQVLATQGLNPTSIGSWTEYGVTRVAVVNTGYLDYNGDTKGEKSSLSVFNTDSMSIEQSFPLPFGGLGVAGEIAIAGGFMAIPSADNSGRIVILDSNNLSGTPKIITIPEAQSKTGPYLVPFAKIYGHYLIAGSYNSGAVNTWDLGTTPPSLVGGTITMDPLGIGDAACVGGDTQTPCKLLITSGDKIMAIE